MSSIVLLAVESKSTNILYNSLASLGVKRVLIEKPIPQLQIAQRRIKRLGLITVFGQALFQLLAVPLIELASRGRISEIMKENNLDDSPIPNDLITNINSVNSATVKELLKEMDPDVIVINGTRIISSKILNSTSAVFLNMHAGITPMYRGVHGGYWALAKGDINNCGVTVHVVDSGIDTGDVFAQTLIHPTSSDSFITYPLLQNSAGLPLLKKAIVHAISGRLRVKESQGKSGLWSHPTLWQYLRNLKRGIK